MTPRVLEIIALTVADAQAARTGGADRVEVVSDMASDGLTPEPALIAELRAAVDLPLRVMLRDRAGFTIDRERLAALAATTQTLRAAGAEEFVFGFLTEDGRVDLAATETMVEAIDGAPWTFHRAIDHAVDAETAWPALCALPGLDFVLTAGTPAKLPAGLSVLADRATWQDEGVRLLVGGGLQARHIPALRGIGVTAVHAGGSVRDGWDSPVDPARVLTLRHALDLDTAP